jgi:predicted pyridoxine 5'-phosphate oxidase superfamily flavin-nucleotide-binding protein
VAGFHEGEREVQLRAGLGEEAARLEGMLAPALVSGGAAMFLAAQPFAVLVARDGDDRLWASPLFGRPGFLEGRGTELGIRAVPGAGDPLHRLPAGQRAAVIAVDLQRRRRIRVNGWLSAVGTTDLTIEVEEAYGNCPSYIHRRTLDADLAEPTRIDTRAIDETGRLTPEAAGIVHRADTFFLGTQHPQRGADASHKGGDPGFVRIDGADILWPDFAGNNMFNSMGNLAIDPAAALLFIDFGTGSLLQLSGTATIEWRSPGESEDDTGRWLRFRPDAGVVRAPIDRLRGHAAHDLLGP